MKWVLRYASVGALTTGLDLLLFHVLCPVLGLSPVAAHVAASFVVLPLSFFGQSWAFVRQATVRRAALFAAVTLSGVYLLQPAILTAGARLLGPGAGVLAVDALKLAAVAAGITWNLIGFRFAVFK